MACTHIAHGEQTAPDGKLRQIFRQHLGTYPKHYFLATFLDNHDMNRFLYECRNDKEKLKAAARLQFSLNQPPIIYYGTEVGMTHELPVGIGGMYSDLQARQPMIWNRPDCKLLAFYKQLIRERKERANANTSRESPYG